MTGRLRTLLARRASRARWGYVPALPALAFFTALGRDEGIPTVLYLTTLGVVCLRQLFRPTLLGWALLFVLFVLSTVSTLYTAAFYASHGVPIDRRQYVLLLARPRTQGDERGAVLLALTLAALMIAPLFTAIL